MLSGVNLAQVSEIFSERQVRLYHACQYVDFVSYVELGGIPSRGLLESRSAKLTPFDTDATDKSKGVWNSVFFNVTDFGKAFADKKFATPNAYGPILLILNPRALVECDDLAICVRSAGARTTIAIRKAWQPLIKSDIYFTIPRLEIRQATQIFGNAQGRVWISYGWNLELSCTVDGELIPMKLRHKR